MIQLVTPTTTAWENPFTDVDLTSDFYNGVAYCNQKGLIQGVSANTFDVDTLATRAMVVTILYRMEGSPTVSGENPFRDVKETDWFYAPVLWASQQGIVNGYDNGAFGASDAITREQLATILMRYAFTQVSNCLYSRLNGVTDVDSIAAYALESVREAVVMGILPVQDKQINPTGSVHRGDLAVAMAALAQNVLTIDKAMLNEYPKSCNYGHPAPLSGKWIQGTAFGTNSYTDGANNDTYDKAWDKDPSTFFDPAEAEPEERYTGIQTTEAYVLTEIRILPRYGWLDRFKGASIQGSNDGKTWTTLWTSESEATEWDYQIISADKIENNTGYTVFRYVNMINHGDVAEIELFGTVKE